MASAEMRASPRHLARSVTSSPALTWGHFRSPCCHSFGPQGPRMRRELPVEHRADGSSRPQIGHLLRFERTPRMRRHGGLPVCERQVTLGRWSSCNQSSHGNLGRATEATPGRRVAGHGRRSRARRRFVPALAGPFGKPRIVHFGRFHGAPPWCRFVGSRSGCCLCSLR